MFLVSRLPYVVQSQLVVLKMSVGVGVANTSSLLSSFAIISLISTGLYVGILSIYRLYYAPVAGFPGPRLAALTFFYEFYYDVWREGQYTWKIQALHKQYGQYLFGLVALALIGHGHLGPFVRINPYEVHCNDPEFFDVLYVSSAKRRTDKSMWAVRQSYEHLEAADPIRIAKSLTTYVI